MRPANRTALSFIKIALFTLCSFISLFTSGQVITTIGGDGTNQNLYNLNGVPAICTGIPYPRGICLDGNGNLYLTVSNSIRKIDASGNISTVAGTDTYGHTGDGGPASAATLQNPYDLCMDNNNNLYISEWSGNCIRKINITTGIISTVAGTGSQGYSGDGGAALSAMLNRPQGIACDVAGNIYFADTYNSRVRKIDVGTGIITTIGGTGVQSHSGDGGLAVNAGTPYPVDVSIGGGGHIYFIEAFNTNTCRVRKIDKTTSTITTVAGISSYAYGGDGGPATAASLFGPSGLCVDAAGNIYISEYDDSRIRKVDASTGIINTIAGIGVNGFAGDAGQPLNATLHYPMGLCLAANGDLFVADNFNHRIRKISATMVLPPSVTTSIVLTASATAICPGMPVSFFNNVVNPVPPPYAFEYFINGVLASSSLVFTTSSLNNGDVVTLKFYFTQCGNAYFTTSNPITITSGTSTPPVVVVSVSDNTICAGEDVAFTALIQNAGSTPSFQWKVNGSNVGNNSAAFSSSTLADGDKVSCTVTGDALSSCGPALSATSNEITMIVSTVQAPSVSVLSSGNEICPGSPVTFTATAQNAGASPAYQWKINGIAAGNNSAVFTYNNFSDNDKVTCQITPVAGVCSANPVSSVPELIIIKPVPVISITPVDTLVEILAQVQIQANVSGSGNSLLWTPSSQLTNPASLQPLTVPLLSDTKFKLLVTASNGCTASAESNIKVYSKLYMPTAFTPNNDGLNDVYRIPAGVTIDLKDFSIYDRWGNRIFKTNDPGKGWDGSLGGIKKDSGIFVYVVAGSDAKGPVFVKGTFTLIR